MNQIIIHKIKSIAILNNYKSIYENNDIILAVKIPSGVPIA